jgi:hypothetical protein
MWCIPKVDGEYVARMEGSTFTARRPIPKELWSASTRARPNSSARFVGPFPPSRAGLSVTTVNIVVTAPSICSSSSTPTVTGAG